MKLKEVRTAINLYSKPKDGHQYLHYESCQIEYIKKSIKFNQTFRLKRICSGKKNFYKHVIELEKWYDKRDEKINCIPLAAIYNPLFENFNSITKRTLITCMLIKKLKKIFLLAPFVSFRRTRNLRILLVKSKIHPLERIVGSKNVR